MLNPNVRHYVHKTYMSMENHGGIILTGKTEDIGEKNCPSTTLSAINVT
jgi:hypothetical protein